MPDVRDGARAWLIARTCGAGWVGEVTGGARTAHLRLGLEALPDFAGNLQVARTERVAFRSSHSGWSAVASACDECAGFWEVGELLLLEEAVRHRLKKVSFWSQALSRSEVGWSA